MNFQIHGNWTLDPGFELLEEFVRDYIRKNSDIRNNAGDVMNQLRSEFIGLQSLNEIKSAGRFAFCNIWTDKQKQEVAASLFCQFFDVVMLRESIKEMRHSLRVTHAKCMQLIDFIGSLALETKEADLRSQQDDVLEFRIRVEDCENSFVSLEDTKRKWLLGPKMENGDHTAALDGIQIEEIKCIVERIKHLHSVWQSASSVLSKMQDDAKSKLLVSIHAGLGLHGNQQWRIGIYGEIANEQNMIVSTIIDHLIAQHYGNDIIQKFLYIVNDATGMSYKAKYQKALDDAIQREEITRLELNKALEQIEVMTKEKEEQKKEIDEAEKRIGYLSSQLATQKEELDKLQEKLGALTKQKNKQKKDLQKAKSEIDSISTQLAEKNERLGKAEEIIEILSKERDEYKHRFERSFTRRTIVRNLIFVSYLFNLEIYYWGINNSFFPFYLSKNSLYNIHIDSRHHLTLVCVYIAPFLFFFSSFFLSLS